MIRVGADKNVYVKDVSCGMFRLTCYLETEANNKFVVDFDPYDFIEGGKKSTGNLIKDMVNYAKNVLAQFPIHGKYSADDVNIVNDSISTIIDYSSNLYPEKDYMAKKVVLESLDFTDGYEIKLVSEVTFFGLLFFKLKLFNGIRTNGVIDINDIIDICYQIFLYTYSPTYRRLLTANALTCIALHEKDFKINSVACWDNFFNDYVITPNSGDITFLPKHIFNHGSKIIGVSNYAECLDVISMNSISANIEIDLEDDITFYTTRPVFKDDDDTTHYSNIAEINAYKMVDKINMLGCSLSVEYKNKGIGSIIDNLFKNVSDTKITDVIDLSKIDDQALLDYKNIPFDKDIDEVLKMDHITLGLKFRNFSSNGSGKITGMDQLSKPSYKIKPIERRDALYTLCCNIFKSIGANVDLGFKNLDVGFKTHYGYIKN